MGLAEFSDALLKGITHLAHVDHWVFPVGRRLEVAYHLAQKSQRLRMRFAVDQQDLDHAEKWPPGYNWGWWWFCRTSSQRRLASSRFVSLR